MNEHEEKKYNEIREELLNNEIEKKVGNYYVNRNELSRYYNAGKLIIEAQGGVERAKYGDGLLKKYSKILTKEIGRGYSTRNLKRMRKYYLFQKGTPLVTQSISWTHYVILLSLNDKNEINYYINEIIEYHWSKRELQKHIKNKEYARKSNQDKTIGIIISRKDNKYLIEYSSDPRIKLTTYKLV